MPGFLKYQSDKPVACVSSDKLSGNSTMSLTEDLCHSVLGSFLSLFFFVILCSLISVAWVLGFWG